VIKQHDNWLLFFALALYVALVAWLVERAPPFTGTDPAVHLWDGLIYQNLVHWLPNFDLNQAIQILGRSEAFPLLRPSGIYPPFVSIIMAASYEVFGRSVQSGIYANFAFLGILGFSVFNIAKEFAGRMAAWIAVGGLLLTPSLLEQTTEAMVELPTAAMLALLLVTVFRSNFFAVKKYSLAAGLVFGLGLLTKLNFVIFATPVIIFAFIQCENAAARKNALYGASLAFVIGLAYFGPLLPVLLPKYAFYAAESAAGNIVDSLADRLVFYFWSLPKLFTFIHIGLILFGLYAIWSKWRTPKGGLLAVSVFAPVIIYILIPNAQDRFIFPLLGQVCVLSSLALVTINKSLYRSLVVGICAAGLSVLFIKCALDRSQLRPDEFIATNFILDEIERTFQSSPQGSSSVKDLAIISDSYFLTAFRMRYASALRDLDLNVPFLNTFRAIDFENFAKRLNQLEFIVAPTQGFTKDSTRPLTIDQYEYFRRHQEDFTPLATLQVEGTEYALYGRRI